MAPTSGSSTANKNGSDADSPAALKAFCCIVNVSRPTTTSR